MAQTTLRLNWTASDGSVKTCVVTTDASGVSLDIGSGKLLANATFGENCPSAGTPPTPVPDPQITDGLDASELPSSSVAGASYTASWSADADSCSYADSNLPAAVTGWPTSGEVCSDAASCATAHRVPVVLPSTTGNYAFVLSCRRNGSDVVATSRRVMTVTAPPPPATGCIAPAGLTRLESAYVEFNYTVSNGRTTDATHFESIFGYSTAETPLRPFPGTVNLNQRVFLSRNGYVALQFTVPRDLALETVGAFRFEETQPQTSPARMSMTISKSCGDFSPTPTPPLTNACVLNNAPANGSLAWGYSPSNAALCQLQPGETYFLNIVHASLNAPLTTYCQGYCGNTIQNQKIGTQLWPGQ
ncbi:hypothetical protein [Tahibacter caeni]|uniref:hypothetical protein n=1 Tax=Tahibacter caeni TaxID=1453545 RepID=UPI0021494E10|nr:hypothetical protein [Tahibacter caeni]